MWDSPWKIDFFVRAGKRKKEIFFKMILLRVLRGTALKFLCRVVALGSEFRLPPPKAVAKSFCHCFKQLFAKMQLDFEQNFKKNFALKFKTLALIAKFKFKLQNFGSNFKNLVQALELAAQISKFKPKFEMFAEFVLKLPKFYLNFQHFA